MTTHNTPLYLISALALAVSQGVNAQQQEQNTQAQANKGLETIVVTGVPRRTTIMASSSSVSSVSLEQVEVSTPRSTAEAFRIIPGVRSESTGGEGNANIAVRGLPVATGGSPFVQIQEDGLPTVLFGDMQFGNNDYWTRFDASTARVESVRGGTATTFASQAPGAIINYISHTGEVEGGYVGLSTGIGYDEKRVDFRYGGSASDSVLKPPGSMLTKAQSQGTYSSCLVNPARSAPHIWEERHSHSHVWLNSGWVRLCCGAASSPTCSTPTGNTRGAILPRD